MDRAALGRPRSRCRGTARPACFWKRGSNDAARNPTPSRRGVGGALAAELGHAIAIEPRRADEMEGPRRSPALAEVRALDETEARIDRGRLERRHVRRREDPREARLVEPPVAAPPVHLHDAERAVDSELALEKGAELSHRHAVAVRERVRSDEALEAGLDDVPLERDTVDRVRPIEHHDLGAGLRCDLHQVPERRLVRVVARPDVLDVEEHDVEVRQAARDSGRRLAAVVP